MMNLITYGAYHRFVRMLSFLALMVASLIALPVNASQTADLMLVLDESGSMIGTYGSDPNNVRYTAVKNLMNSLAGGTVAQNAGLVYFSSSAALAVPLSNISTAVGSINAVATPTGAGSISGGGTNMASAIQTATNAFANSSAAAKVMLIFTDGAADSTSAAVTAASAAAAQGITVNIIALGSQASSAAASIAAAGNGKVLTATDPQQLLSLFSAGSIFGGGTTTTNLQQEIAKAVASNVTPQVQRATSIQQATIISSVLSNIFSARAPTSPGAPMRMSFGNEKGMAAGDAPTHLNAWFNASDTTIGSSATASLFDGYVTNAIGGVDYRISEKFVAGVSAGYDRTSLDFKFLGLTNSGMTSTGWMVAPYASYQISDMISVDGALGYAEGDVDSRTSGTTSNQKYDRNFVALNLNGNYWMGDWQLTGKANYIMAEENVTDTTNKMEQLRLGGQVGYWVGGVMPYAGITYVRDLKVSTSAPGGMPASADKDAWVASVGVNLFSKGALSGGISYTEEFDRADSKNYTFMANIGYRF